MVSGGNTVQAGRTAPIGRGVPAFTTPLGTRVESVLFVLFVGSGSFLVSLGAGAFACYLAWLSGAPWAIAGVPGLLVWLYLMRVTWSISTAPLRFCVTLAEDTVDLGSGWLKCTFPYSGVEEISLPDRAKQYGVSLEGGGRGAFVYLSGPDEAACVAALRSRCANALFVDRWGTEHLPENPDRPLVPLSALCRRCRGLAWGGFVGSLLAGTMAFGMAIGICAFCLGQRQGIPLAEFARGCVEFPLLALATVAGATLARRNWKRARAIRMSLDAFRHETRDAVG